MSRGPLPFVETTARLQGVGIQLPATVVFDDPADARDAVDTLRCDRLVLKAGGLLHKTDEGGVVPGLSGSDAVERAAGALLDRLGSRALPLQLQEQVDGVEVLVGLRRDPALGAVLVVGAGGILAEILEDVSRSLVPVGASEARAMVDRLKVRRLLSGARGAAPSDLEALVSVIIGVSRLAERHPDIVELDLNPVLVGPVGSGAVAVDARIIVDPTVSAAPSRGVRTDLDALLDPHHVAVVGVSDDSAKIGSRLFQHLLRHGFAGRVDPIHPRGGEVLGHPRAAALRDLDAVPDLVCVAVPADQVVEVAREAAELRVGAVLVHSSDFAEIGDEGRRLQDELVDVLRARDVPLAGPNDMGLVTPRTGMAASISGALGSVDLIEGTTAVVSSSGALGSCLATRLMYHGVGLSRWIHVGNEADVTMADYLHWLVDDPTTASVGLLVEDIKHGRAFATATRALVAAGKPVFAYHMVRSAEGVAAAQSHTGALAGSFELREAVLRAGGVVSVPSLQVLEDALRLVAFHELPAGRRLAALTFSGGACTIIADAADRFGFELPQLDTGSLDAIRSLLPPFAAVRNPMDVSFQLVTHPDRFQTVLRALVEGEGFDAVFVQFTTNADPQAARTAEAVVTVIDDATLPVYVARYGGAQLAPDALAIYARAGVPVLDAPDRCMQAFAALAEAWEFRAIIAAAPSPATSGTPAQLA